MPSDWQNRVSEIVGSDIRYYPIGILSQRIQYFTVGIVSEIIGFLSEFVGCGWISCRIRWDPSSGFFDLGTYIYIRVRETHIFFVLMQCLIEY